MRGEDISIIEDLEHEVINRIYSRLQELPQLDIEWKYDSGILRDYTQALNNLERLRGGGKFEYGNWRDG